MKRFLFYVALSFPMLAISENRELPFDPEVVNRQSLNGVPRSLAVRQGERVWLGYDLKRGTVFRAWQAPADEAGLDVKGFVTRAQGNEWFADDSGNTWRLKRKGKEVSIKARYLACSHRVRFVELRWELRHESGSVYLHERVPLENSDESVRALREMRVSGLEKGETVEPPPATAEHWKIVNETGDAVSGFAENGAYRLNLP